MLRATRSMRCQRPPRRSVLSLIATALRAGRCQAPLLRAHQALSEPYLQGFTRHVQVGKEAMCLSIAVSALVRGETGRETEAPRFSTLAR